MAVFSIFNHGTDFHRDKDPYEVITLLSENVEGTEARIVKLGEPTDQDPLPYGLQSRNPTFLICEGPGSDKVGAEQSKSGVSHAHPGQNNPIFDTSKATTPKQINPKLRDKSRRWFGLRGPDEDFRKDFMGLTEQHGKTAGRALGRGWDDNVYKAVWLLTHLNFEAGAGIDTVNIAGWSRGAVTCLKMANRLYEIFETKIKVNIYAIDPVPGGLTWETDDMKIIPPNVRNYFTILALDDTRNNFLPLDREEVKVRVPTEKVPAPQVHFLPLPGNHSDIVQTVKKGGYARESAEMCLHLAYKFLKAHGTRFKSSFNKDLSPDAALAKYATLLANRKTIKSKAESALLDPVGGRRVDRHVRKHRHLYVMDHNFFLNEHHRQLLLAPKVAASEIPSLKVMSGSKTYVPAQAYLFQMGISYA